MTGSELLSMCRHALGIIGPAFLGVVVQAIISAGGVSGLDWAGVLVDAVDTAVVAGASGLVVLIGTPATRKYGLFSDRSPKHLAG